MLQFTTSQRQTLIWTALALLIGLLMYHLAAVLTPFLFAAILAYMLNPGVDALTRYKFPRWLAVFVVITAVLSISTLIVLIIVPVLQGEVLQLQQRLPQILTRLNETVSPRLYQWFDVRVDFNATSLRQLISDQWANEDMLTMVLSSIKIGGIALIGMLVNVVLVPIVLFYLLLDWHALIRMIGTGIPRRWYEQATSMAIEINALLSQFLRGQLLVMILVAIYYSIALTLAGFDIALPIGLITGLLAFVPYLGFSAGLLLATLAAILQFSGWYGLIAVAIIYGFGQILETYILTPRLVGERIGLHPLAVIFALLAFGQLFGFFGVLLALPASAALLVGLRRIKGAYLKSDLYRSTP